MWKAHEVFQYIFFLFIFFMINTGQNWLVSPWSQFLFQYLVENANLYTYACTERPTDRQTINETVCTIEYNTCTICVCTVYKCYMCDIMTPLYSFDMTLPVVTPAY